MEIKTRNKQDTSASWSYATNWTIADGSLDTITVESSDSVVDSESEAVTDSAPKSPLVLKPPSPDTGPCEITVYFSRKHEIRQVYVRSTSRVYEIYLASSHQSSNDYLCTVRCGVAARGEELLYADVIEEVEHAHSKEPDADLTEIYLKGEIYSGTNADGWVEVDSTQFHSRQSLLPQHTSAMRRSIEELYEATAEISDIDCMSLTLRLLSIQRKGCVYIDEIYVFVDPVESADSENGMVQVGTGGSSLMAMLVPTLMQLSKSGISRKQDKDASDPVGKCEYEEIEKRAAISTKSEIKPIEGEKSSTVECEGMKLPEISGATDQPPVVKAQPLLSDGKKDEFGIELVYSKVDRVLEELVSRVSKIEELCLSFEEKMVKPMNSMEVRLQRVEQQLEIIAKSSQHSGLPSGTKICAPSFSCIDSNTCSLYDDGNDNPLPGESELGKSDFSSDNICSYPPRDTCPGSAPQFLPSLVVTAPEFSCDEDEDSIQELSKDFHLEKAKKVVSIDDALAAALAGLFISTNTQGANQSEAPEFANEEDCNGEENDNDDKMASTSTRHETTTLPAIFCRTVVNDCKNDDAEFTSESTSESVRQELITPGDDSNEEMSKGDNGQDGGTNFIVHNINTDCLMSTLPAFFCRTVVDDCKNGDAELTPGSISESVRQELLTSGDDSNEEMSKGDNSQDGGTDFIVQDMNTDCPYDEVKKGLETREALQIAEGIDSNRFGNIFLVQEALDNSLEDSSHSAQDAGASIDAAAGWPDRGMLQNVFNPSHTVSVVDFETPILEVKFTYGDSSSIKSPLEILLTDEVDINIEVPSFQGCDNGSEQQDGESFCHFFETDLLVDLDCYPVVPAHSEGIGLQDHHTSTSPEMVVSLI